MVSIKNICASIEMTNPVIMPEHTYIYGLFDPRTSEIKYIGKADNIAKRLNRHLNDRTGNLHKKYWLEGLRSIGLKPEIEVLEEVAYSEWQSAEKFWIAYYQYIGARLTNLDAGGTGGYMRPFTPEMRKKIGDSHRGKPLSEETKKKLSEVLTGRKMSEEFRQKTSERMQGKQPPQSAFDGRKEYFDSHPEEADRLRTLRKGVKWTEEERKKLSDSHKGKPHNPEWVKKQVRNTKRNKELRRIIQEIYEENTPLIRI